jgi:hypothetical protein
MDYFTFLRKVKNVALPILFEWVLPYPIILNVFILYNVLILLVVSNVAIKIRTLHGSNVDFSFNDKR